MKSPVVVLASDNISKFAEFSNILAGICELKPQSEFNLQTPPETGTTFTQNAILKARHTCLAVHLPVLADDSGLMVEALSGAPGLFSSRYAGDNASDADNLKKLLANISTFKEDDLNACFHCSIAYVEPDLIESPRVVSALWGGRLVHKPAGVNGFGYDPVFYVAEYACTAAQLDPAVKNTISHRARALHKLRSLLINHLRDTRSEI